MLYVVDSFAFDDVDYYYYYYYYLEVPVVQACLVMQAVVVWVEVVAQDYADDAADDYDDGEGVAVL